MSRKNRIPRPFKGPSQQRGGTILGVFIGMILGAAIVAAMAFFFSRNDNPFSQTSSTKQSAGTPTGAPSVPGATPAQQTPGQVATLPGKPGDPPVEKPHFSFFGLLPGGENTSAPTSTPPEQPPVSAPPVQAPLEKQVYLQLEAFENAAQADDLRARLIMMGLDPVTQRVQLDGRIVHRIRIGPFTDREDLKAMRARLVSNGVNAEEVSN